MLAVTLDVDAGRCFPDGTGERSIEGFFTLMVYSTRHNSYGIRCGLRGADASVRTKRQGANFMMHVV